MLIVDTHFEDNAINELEFIPLGGEPISRPAPQSLIALGDYNGSIPIAVKVISVEHFGYNIYDGDLRQRLPKNCK